MLKVHMVSKSDVNEDRRFSNRSADLLRVTSVDVKPSDMKPILYLQIDVLHGDTEEGRRLELALSPPAAKQLAKFLNQGVDNYLKSAPLSIPALTPDMEDILHKILADTHNREGE